MVEKRVEENLRTSQMADDALNVDFLNWLKKWGPNIIIVMAIAVISFQGYGWWIRKAEDRQSEAWADLETTTTVVGLQNVASENLGIGSIAELAWLSAADMHYGTLLTNEALEEDALSGLGGDGTGSDDPDDPENAEDTGPKQLSEADRADILDKMEFLYQQVIDSTKNDSKRDLLQLRALYGQAAVAEMRLDQTAARGWYEQAAAVAGDTYPKYAALARARIADMEEANVKIEIMTQDELNAINDAKKVPELLQRPVGPTNEDGSFPTGDDEAENPDAEKPVDEATSDDADGEGAEEGDGEGGGI